MVKRGYNAGKLAVHLSKTDRKALVAKADEALFLEGSRMSLNENLASIDPKVYPEIKDLKDTAHVILDNELRKLVRKSMSTPEELTSAQSRHLAVLSRAICQLGQLHMNLLAHNDVELLTDRQLCAATSRAFDRMHDILKLEMGEGEDE